MTPTVRVLFTVVGSAGYLGLAVLCWGGLAALFPHPALAALPVAFCVMGGAVFFAKGNRNPRVREDRNNPSADWLVLAELWAGWPKR
jgi:hypothetical protein